MRDEKTWHLLSFTAEGPPQPWTWSRVSMVYPTLNSFDKEKEEYEAAIREMGIEGPGE